MYDLDRAKEIEKEIGIEGIEERANQPGVESLKWRYILNLLKEVE